MARDPETTTSMATGSGASWTQRAEDRPGAGGGRLVAQLVTPFVAVVPWLLTAAGALLLANASIAYRLTYETGWAELVGGVLLTLLAAAIWAALTVWSSVGATVAGLCTLVLGIVAATEPGARMVYRIGREGPVSLQSSLYIVATPTMLIPLGSLLIAAGLGAAGARRLRRRRS